MQQSDGLQLQLQQLRMQVEAAIAQLYAPSSSPQARKEAEDWLQSFQRLNEAWPLSRIILASSQASEVRFFGASTLLVKISRDWQEDTLNLRDELIQQLCLSSGGPSFVTKKLCACLAGLMFKTVPETWSTPLVDTITHLQSRIQSSPDPSLSIAIELTLLDFLTVLPEEIRRTVFSSESRRVRFHSAVVLGEVGVALGCVGTVMALEFPPRSNATENGGGYRENLVELKKKALEYVGTTIQTVISHLTIPETYEIASKVLVELLSLPLLRPYEETVCQTLLPVLTSGWLRSEFDRALKELDPASLQPLCEIITSLGEKFPKFIVKNMTRPDVLTLLEMVLACSSFPGFYGVDEEISNIPNEFWYEIEEVLTGELVFPRPSSSHADPMVPFPDFTTDPATGKPVFVGGAAGRANIHRLDRIRIASDLAGGGGSGQGELEEAERVWRVSVEIFSRLLGIFRWKVRRPGIEEWAAWSSEYRDRFRSYRQDATEILLSCRKILTASMDIHLASVCMQECTFIPSFLSSPASAPEDILERVEAALFCIKACAEEVSVRDGGGLQGVFGEGVLGVLVGLLAAGGGVFGTGELTRSFGRVIVGMCLLIAAPRHPQWLARHPQYVLSVVRFLLVAAGIPYSSRAAVNALDEVCDHCRKVIANGGVSGELVEGWMRNGVRVGAQDQPKLLRAVSRTLQPLPPSLQLPLLTRILASLTSDLRKTLHHLSATISSTTLPTPEGFLAACAEREIVLEVVGMLRGVCQGVQEGDEEDEAVVEGVLVEEGEGVFGAGVLKEAEDAGRGVWECILGVGGLFVLDRDVVEAVSNFVNETLTGSPPQIFRPQVDHLASHLSGLFERNRSPFVLKSLTLLVQNVSDDGPNAAGGGSRVWLRDVVGGVSMGCCEVLAVGGIEEFPDVCEGFFRFIGKVLHTHPWVLLTLPPELLSQIFTQVLPLGIRSQERLSAISAIEFFKSCVAFDPLAGDDALRRRRDRRRRKAGGDTAEMVREEAGIAQAKREEAGRLKEGMEEIVRGVTGVIVGVAIMGIGGAQPSSMVSLLSGLLHEIVKRFPYEARNWFVAALSGDGIPSRFCTNSDKEVVVKGMFTTNPKEFREMMARFSLKSRNLQDTAYGASTHLV
ncbi:hypothetical protein HDU67_001196 [Dinochytrium kinnereticum]|nr:hypothetical protein HDU67_001196 [Dinochytrium kinnereticum]